MGGVFGSGRATKLKSLLDVLANSFIDESYFANMDTYIKDKAEAHYFLLRAYHPDSWSYDLNDSGRCYYNNYHQIATAEQTYLSHQPLVRGEPSRYFLRPDLYKFYPVLCLMLNVAAKQ